MVKWLAVAEFVFGVGALVVLGETNPLYYLLVIGVGVVIVALVAYDQRHRERTEEQQAARRVEVGRAADHALAAALEPSTRAAGSTDPGGTEATRDTVDADGSVDTVHTVDTESTRDTVGAQSTRGTVGAQSTRDTVDTDGSVATAVPVAAHEPAPRDRASEASGSDDVEDDLATVDRGARIAPLRSTREEFVAALVEYGMRTGVRTITRNDRDGWAEALRVEYELLRAAACCAENEREIVGELVMWDSVSVLHLLDTPEGLGNGISRSVVAPYGRLPAATRVPVRRDPARFTCEVATLALDPLVADEYALNLLWRGIYDHARRGGATEVVWTLAADLAALWRERFGFPLEVLGDNRRSSSTATVTVLIPLPELENRLVRERPAYYGWLTVGFADAERAALGLPVDLSGAYDRVCAFVMAKLDDVRSPLALR